jgi:hypothetical protein
MSKIVRETYEKEGYALVKGLLNEKRINLIRKESERLLGDARLIRPWNLRCRWQNNVPPGGRLEALDPISDLSPVIREVLTDPALKDILAGVLGGEPMVLKDKLIYKLPGSQGYPLHQDYIAWPEFPRNTAQALIAIDPSCTETGCLEVFPGEHRGGHFPIMNGKVHAMDPAWANGKTSRLLQLEPGDVVFFHTLLPHRSAPNQSSKPRRHLYLTYNHIEEGDLRDRYYTHHFTWSKDMLTKAGTPVYFV